MRQNFFFLFPDEDRCKDGLCCYPSTHTCWTLQLPSHVSTYYSYFVKFVSSLAGGMISKGRLGFNLLKVIVHFRLIHHFQEIAKEGQGFKFVGRAKWHSV